MSECLVCKLGWVKCAEHGNDKLKELIEKQIDDESLWHWPKSDLEKALRDALLEVHGVVESED